MASDNNWAIMPIRHIYPSPYKHESLSVCALFFGVHDSLWIKNYIFNMQRVVQQSFWFRFKFKVSDWTNLPLLYFCLLKHCLFVVPIHTVVGG